jgi:hypothetical protein
MPLPNFEQFYYFPLLSFTLLPTNFIKFIIKLLTTEVFSFLFIYDISCLIFIDIFIFNHLTILSIFAIFIILVPSIE